MRFIIYLLIVSQLLFLTVFPVGLSAKVLPLYSSLDPVQTEVCTLSPKIQINQPLFTTQLGLLSVKNKPEVLLQLIMRDDRRKAWADEFVGLYQKNAGNSWKMRLHAAMHFIQQDIAAGDILNDFMFRKQEYSKGKEVLFVRRVLAESYPENEDMLNLYDLALLAIMQNVELICAKCSYPHGFLNVKVNEKNGVCSACTYLENHPELSDMFALKKILDGKIAEAKKIRQAQSQTMKEKYDYDNDGVFQIYRDIDPKVKYDCVVGFSGGKDSVYVAYELLKEYGLNVLLVFDDIEASSELARENINLVLKNLRYKFGKERVGFVQVGFKPGLIGKVRSDFMRAGQSFCRACLRSHWGMVYREAINAATPLFFYGFSRLQHLTDIIGIKLAQDTIKTVSMPFSEIDRQELAQTYRYRATVHDLEIGYQDTAQQRTLYNIIKNIYFQVPQSMVPPLLIPYFLFVQAPDTNNIKQIIAREIGWKIPANSMGNLAHTNCQFEDLGEVIYRSVTGSSTKLRELGVSVREGEMTLRENLQRQIKEIQGLSVSENELTRAMDLWGGISAEEVLKNNPRIAWYFQENASLPVDSSALVFEAQFIDKLIDPELRNYAEQDPDFYDYQEIFVYVDKNRVAQTGQTIDTYIKNKKQLLINTMHIPETRIKFIVYETENDLSLRNEIKHYQRVMIMVDENSSRFDQAMAQRKRDSNYRIITGDKVSDYFFCAKILKNISKVFTEDEPGEIKLTDEMLQAMGNYLLNKQSDVPLNLVISGCFKSGSTHKYKGGDNYNRHIDVITKPHNAVFTCPETLSGLSTPRTKIGISAQDSRIYTLDENPAIDLTDKIAAASEKLLKELENHKPDAAILKSGSPTCSADEVFVYEQGGDGMYSSDKNKRKKIKGDAVFARFLKNQGVLILTERDFNFINEIEQGLATRGVFDATFFSKRKRSHLTPINMSI